MTAHWRQRRTTTEKPDAARRNGTCRSAVAGLFLALLVVAHGASRPAAAIQSLGGFHVMMPSLSLPALPPIVEPMFSYEPMVFNQFSFDASQALTWDSEDSAFGPHPTGPKVTAAVGNGMRFHYRTVPRTPTPEPDATAHDPPHHKTPIWLFHGSQ